MQHMERALALGWGALGTTSPNPAVGCVIVRDGEIVSEGWTHPPGQQHAEAAALAQAGVRARGATLYTTLEPCNHYGRTPPCSEAIIAAGISEVHAAVRDPNANVAGGGIERLYDAGIRTHIGECTDEAGRLIEAFSKHSRTRMPFVTVKYAMSLDGKIAARSGDSKWISGEESRRYAHLLRARSDAIMVGINTVLADDPQLTARDAEGNPNKRQPLRVVLDSQGRMPQDAQMLKAPGDTLIAVVDAIPDAFERATRDGAETIRLPAGRGGVDLYKLLVALGERDVTSVLVEGGGATIGALFDMNLVDKVVAFVAPVIIGGNEAISPVGGIGIAGMEEALRLKSVEVMRFGEDVAVVGYINAESGV